jgi:hypothetical protein
MVTAASSKFSAYALNSRAPIHFTGPSGWRKIEFEDEYRGAFAISFSGGENWFAYHLPKIGYGVLHKHVPGASQTWGMKGLNQRRFMAEAEARLGHPIEMTMFLNCENGCLWLPPRPLSTSSASHDPS